jgi:exodeoxyribonuclease VII small subunit
MPDDTEAEIGFETALEELERIVAELEQGGPDLTAALGRYERGVRLLNRCQTLLDGAERSVALLTGVDDEGRPITAPFDASATAEAVAPASVPPPPKPRKAKVAAPDPTPTPPPPPLVGFDPEADPDDLGPPW